jgi:hypothetical protein
MVGRELAGRSVVAGVIGTLCLAVGGLGVATAANGGSLVLGHHNTATSTTTLKNDRGTPLALVGKKSKPPLKVNSSKQVKHLNASLLDGESASTLSHTITYTAGAAGQKFTGDVSYKVNIKPGLYDISFQSVFEPGDGTPAAPAQSQCALFSQSQALGKVYVASSAGYFGTGVPAFSGDNVTRILPGGVSFLCTTDATDPSTLMVPNTISFTTVNSRTSRVAPTLSTTFAKGRNPFRWQPSAPAG